MNTGGAFVAGSIVGKLLLDKSGWNTAIKSVDKDTAELIKQAEKVSAAHQKVGLMFTGVGLAVVGSLTAMVKKTADFGDELFDLSQITGISAATLSSFKLAADKSGTSLEGIALGLRFLGRNMAAAVAGTGAAKDAFKALGIAVADSAGKLRPMDEVMMEVADRFASMENGAEKTALAIKLFGRSGSELIPFLNLGRAGLAELRKEAERLGIVMSDTDAAASDKFKDALVSLEASVKGVGMTIGKTLIPIAQQLADMFTRVISGVNETMNKNGPLTQQLAEMAGVFGVVAIAAGGFHLALSIGIRTMATTAAALQTTVGALTITTAAWTALASAVVFYILKLQELETAKADLNRADEAFWEMQGRIITKLQDVATVAGIHHDAMAELYNSYGAGNVALAEQAIRMGEWESKFPGITAALEQVAAKSKAAYDALHPLAIAVHGLTVEQEALLTSLKATFGSDVRKEIAETEATLAAYKKTNDATPAGVKALEDRIEALRASLEKINPTFQTLEERLETVNDDVRMFRMFGVDAANSVNNSFGTLGDVVGGTLGDIINSADAIDPDMFKGIGTAVTDIYNTVKKEAIDPLAKAFDGLYNDIATGFANAIEGLFSGLSKAEKKRKTDLQAELRELDKAYARGEISLEEYTAKYKETHDEMMAITGGFSKFFSSIWGTIKQAFFRVIGEMVAGFIINFVKKIIVQLGIVKAFMSALGIGGSGRLGNAAVSAAGGAIGETMASGAAAAGATAGTSIVSAWVLPVAFAAVWLGMLFGRLFGKSAADKWKEAFDAKMKAKYGADWSIPPTVISRGSLSKPATPSPPNADLPGSVIPYSEWAAGFEGIISKPTHALIGEAGPEYVSIQPLNAATMPRFNSAPAMSMASSGGVKSGGDINVTLNVSTLDGESVVSVVRNKVIPVLREAARRREFWIPLGSAGGV